MSIRNAFLVTVLAGAASIPALADEASYIQPAPQFGVVKAAVPAAPSRIEKVGDVSTDARYVFLGSEVGWSARPHNMLVQGGTLVHGDGCVHGAAQPDRRLSQADLALNREIQIGG